MNDKDLNRIVVSGGIIDWDKYMNAAHLIIKGDTVINAINLHNDLNLKIKIEKGKSLVINMFDYAVSLDVALVIEADENSNFVINSSFISDVKYTLNIDTIAYGDNTFGEVNIRGINERNSVIRIVMNGTVAGKTKNCVLNEYAHVLNKSNNSNVIIPNLIVNTNEVEANHGVTVGQIDEEKLFYLLSKGISRPVAAKIIEEGFLLSIMPDDIHEKIKNILVGR